MIMKGLGGKGQRNQGRTGKEARRRKVACTQPPNDTKNMGTETEPATDTNTHGAHHRILAIFSM